MTAMKTKSDYTETLKELDDPEIGRIAWQCMQDRMKFNCAEADWGNEYAARAKNTQRFWGVVGEMNRRGLLFDKTLKRASKMPETWLRMAWDQYWP